MDIKRLFNNDNKIGVSGLFCLSSSVGYIDGEKFELTELNGTYETKAETEDYILKSAIEKNEQVYIRRDTFRNKTDKPIYIYKYLSRFTYESDEAECYTQHSNWVNESRGKWQDIVTCISAENYGIRSTAGAAPFFGIWDRNTGRGIAFNIVPNTAWQFDVSKKAKNGIENIIVIEAGMQSETLNFEVLPGETVIFPEIVFYEFENKTDMACAKLHRYLSKAYPQKSLPVIYNTWFANFDEFDTGFLKKQAEKAAYLGVEYFVVDAGWFGAEKSWDNSIGDWEEKTSGGFDGKMTDFSRYVRSLGMKFGFWIEAERALPGTKAVVAHPEYYIFEGGNYFLDFANEDAREYMCGIVMNLIDKYSADFVKFDFNADCVCDNRHSAFYRYNEGHKKFIEKIRGKYPDIYLENCASGGTRMDLFHGAYMDGIWFSDNQNPRKGIEILRETILRMPPQKLERWAVLANAEGFPAVYSENRKTHRLLTVGGATWQRAETIGMKYMENFCTGGAFGVTCDLTKLNEQSAEELKNCISEFKKMRDFYKEAVCIPLVSTDTFTVLQYTDREEMKVIIQVFDTQSCQSSITVYPKLRQNRNYDGYTAEYLKENGITFELNHESNVSDDCASIILISGED